MLAVYINQYLTFFVVLGMLFSKQNLSLMPAALIRNVTMQQSVKFLFHGPLAKNTSHLY